MGETRHVASQEFGEELQRLFEGLKQGDAVFVERGGEEKAALVDVVDYRLLRSYARAQAINAGRDVSPEDLDTSLSGQDRYDVAMALYVAKKISAARMAESVELPLIELRRRFSELGIPLRTAPKDEEEAQNDVATATTWHEEQ